jgi:hypothetical protein
MPLITNPRAFARARGEQVSAYVGPHVLRDVILHDSAHRCTCCGNWFSSASDMEGDECFFCRWNLQLPGEALVLAEAVEADQVSRAA